MLYNNNNNTWLRNLSGYMAHRYKLVGVIIVSIGEVTKQSIKAPGPLVQILPVL